MSEIIYTPALAGTEFVNAKGKNIRCRKYHLTLEEMEITKLKWELEVSSVDPKIRRKVGKHFFNPYRQGIYYYQLQTLFLLGANKWHSLSDVTAKLEAYTTGIKLNNSITKKYGYRTAWDKFRGKSRRSYAHKCKDYIGRIQENFIFFQRLSRKHPYGYKLHQVHAAVDIKRVSKVGFEQGVFYYRLSTYPTMAEALPIKDFSKFVFPKHKGKYINYKFIGTIITKDQKIVEGVLV